MRHPSADTIDWIETGTFSPQGALTDISERTTVKMTLKAEILDFQISDVWIQDSEVRVLDLASGALDLASETLNLASETLNLASETSPGSES